MFDWFKKIFTSKKAKEAAIQEAARQAAYKRQAERLAEIARRRRQAASLTTPYRQSTPQMPPVRSPMPAPAVQPATRNDDDWITPTVMFNTATQMHAVRHDNEPTTYLSTEQVESCKRESRYTDDDTPSRSYSCSTSDDDSSSRSSYSSSDYSSSDSYSSSSDSSSSYSSSD